MQGASYIIGGDGRKQSILYSHRNYAAAAVHEKRKYEELLANSHLHWGSWRACRDRSWAFSSDDNVDFLQRFIRHQRDIVNRRSLPRVCTWLTNIFTPWPRATQFTTIGMVKTTQGCSMKGHINNCNGVD